MRIINIRPPRIALAFTVLAGAVHWSMNLGESMRLSIPWAGVSIGIAGFFLMMWSWLLFKKQNLAVCPLAITVHITQAGPYRFSRNPMYLGMVLMMLGLALYVGSLPFYVVTFIYFALLNLVFCPYEESKLIAAFGEEYLRYKRRIRRWL